MATDYRAMSVEELQRMVDEASAVLYEKKVEGAMQIRLNQRIAFNTADGRAEGKVVMIDVKGVQCEVEGAERKRRVRWEEVIEIL